MRQRLFPGYDLHGRSIFASRFSQPLDAFIRPMSASLVSCWIHVWGFYPPELSLLRLPTTVSDSISPSIFAPTFQPAKSPPMQQYAVSDAIALMSLRHPYLHSVSHWPSDCSASCEPGLRLSECPSPSGPCSTPKSATSCRWVRPTRAHGSHGLFVLRGSLPPRHNQAFTRLPLTSFL